MSAPATSCRLLICLLHSFQLLRNGRVSARRHTALLRLVHLVRVAHIEGLLCLRVRVRVLTAMRGRAGGRI